MQTERSASVETVSFWVFLGCTILSGLTFVKWMPTTFFGDDLANLWDYLQGAFPSDIVQALTQTPGHKYRPAFHWVQGALFELFGESVRAYLLFNVLLHAINATLFFRLAWHLTNRNLVVAMGAAVLIAMSRFGLYQVTQVTGLVEGLAFSLFLVSLLLVTRAARSEDRWRDLSAWLAACTALLALATHERYIVYVAWLASILLLRPALVGRPGTWVLIGTSLAASVPGYFLAKKVLLGAPSLLGTDGKGLAFEFARAQDHATQALLSLSGYNYGPEYLIGATGCSFGSVFVFCAIAVALVWLTCLLYAGSIADRVAPGARPKLGANLESSLAFLTLAGAMFLPMLATVRLEQRWLVQPFALIVLVFCIALSVGLEKRRVFFISLGALYFFLQGSLDLAYSTRLDRVSFVSAGRFAAEIDAIARSVGVPRSIAIVGSPEHCEWTLRRGDFFRLRYGIAVKVACFADTKAVLAATLPEGTLVLRQTRIDGGLLELTDEDLEYDRKKSHEQVVIDLVASFTSGQVSSDRKVDSPSGRGSMIASWEDATGQRPSLTVVSGFAHVYKEVTVAAPSRVRSLAAMVYPSDAGATAVVTARLAGWPDVVARVPLQPRPKSGRWIRTAIDLPLDQPGRYTIEFAVQTTAGVDTSGHWVAFTDARVVQAESPRNRP